MHTHTQTVFLDFVKKNGRNNKCNEVDKNLTTKKER
jgi:hypothetical protein